MEKFRPVIEYQDFNPRKLQNPGSCGRNRVLAVGFTTLALMALLSGCNNSTPLIENPIATSTVAPTATMVPEITHELSLQADGFSVVDITCSNNSPQSIRIAGEVQFQKPVDKTSIVLEEVSVEGGKFVVVDEINTQNKNSYIYEIELGKEIISKGDDGSRFWDTITLQEGNAYKLFLISGNVQRDNGKLTIPAGTLLKVIAPIDFRCGQKKIEPVPSATPGVLVGPQVGASLIGVNFGAAA